MDKDCHIRTRKIVRTPRQRKNETRVQNNVDYTRKLDNLGKSNVATIRFSTCKSIVLKLSKQDKHESFLLNKKKILKILSPGFVMEFIYISKRNVFFSKNMFLMQKKKKKSMAKNLFFL